MKKMALAIIVFALVSLGGIFIFAQKSEGGRRGFGRFGERGFLRMAEKLNLTAEQKTQVKQIMEDAKTRIKPLMETARENHKQMENLGTDGTFNESEVQRLAAAQSETMKQLIVEKEKTKAAVFAVLTPEQRTQAQELKNQFKERMKGRFEKRFGGQMPIDGIEE